MKKDDSYSNYAQKAIEEFAAKSETERNLLAAEISNTEIEKQYKRK